MLPLNLSRALGQQCPPGMVPQVTISPTGTETFKCVPGGTTGGTDAGGGTGGGGGILQPAPAPAPAPGGGGMLPGGTIPGTLPGATAPFPGTIPGTTAPFPGLPPSVPPSLPPAKVPPSSGTSPTGLVDTSLVEGILSDTDAAWEKAEVAILRGRRCGASESDKENARKASACLATFSAAAGTLSVAMAELCAAKNQGRPAHLNAAQVGALEALVVCMGEVPTPEGSSPNWLKALIGAGLPAAGSILISA
jgi:hypothetical protein